MFWYQSIKCFGIRASNVLVSKYQMFWYQSIVLVSKYQMFWYQSIKCFGIKALHKCFGIKVSNV